MPIGEYMRFTFMCKREKPKEIKNKNIAIVGAGPSGLAATGYLACKGYSMTVFERLPFAGGMMVFGIPEFRIPRERIFLGLKELEEIFNVKIKTSCKIIGDNRSEIIGDNFVKEYVELENIMDDFDAVLITTGTWISKKLPAEGFELNGIYSALEYLFKIKSYELGLIPKKNKIKLGSNVVVVGAGLVAVDAALEAIREGSNVRLISIERLRESPAGIFEINKLKEKGAEHIESSVIKKVIGKEKVESIEVVDIDAEIKNGMILKLEQIGGTERVVDDVDNIIVAIGQIPTPPVATDNFGIKMLKWGAIEIDDGYMTSKKKVFATGDVVTGISKVGRAFQSGLKAAESLDRFFQNKTCEVSIWQK